MNFTFVLRLLAFFIISCAVVLSLCFAFGVFDTPEYLSNTANTPGRIVVIDAGHGGEDGGASSKSGLVEKNVNLELATLLCDLLRSEGIEVVMTRTDDRLLYDRNVNFEGRKKKLDLAARLEVAKTYEDCLFVSIHMNSFSDARYSGLQVWYSQNDPSSMVLAQMIQSGVRQSLQPNNKRTIKPADSKIFLLDNAISPAVLIECGFLSNPDEAAKFESADYKKELMQTIFNSIMEFLEQE